MQKSKGLAQHLLSVEAPIRGVDGLREPRSHAVHHPRTIDPEIERRIIELGREHPDWGKKRKNRGTTADRPNKTINIDLCLVHAREVHEPNFSAFFQRMDELCEKSPEKGEEDAVATKDSGLGIFSQEKLSYVIKRDAGREGMEGCGGIDDGFGRGYLSIQ